MTGAPRQARQRRLGKRLQHPDLPACFEPILLELNLPDGHLEERRRLHPRLPVVVLSCSELSGEQLGLVNAAPGKSRMNTQHLLTILARLLPAKEPSNA
jgi:hypothetical protein